MSTFALVHGAWHGAWCWDALTPLLTAAGHDVVVMDLPSDDPEATFDDYADTVVASLAGRADDVIVVGHSLAGMTIPLVAVRRPVRALVYVCALLPAPGRSLLQQMHDDPETFLPGYRDGLEVVDDAGTTRWRDLDLARETFFADCPPDVAARAVGLLRAQATTPYRPPCSLETYPDVPSTYVVCSEDRIVNPEWSRRRAPEVTDRVVELPGSHSPFLSRPAELAALLLASA